MVYIGKYDREFSADEFWEFMLSQYDLPLAYDDVWVVQNEWEMARYYINFDADSGLQIVEDILGVDDSREWAEDSTEAEFQLFCSEYSKQYLYDWFDIYEDVTEDWIVESFELLLVDIFMSDIYSYVNPSKEDILKIIGGSE